jgi:NADPH:quinone reductase-like Zn-dependent oxidoreductase
VEGLKGDEAARKRNEGVRVLATGASGAVGGWAVRLARLAGARVVGVSVEEEGERRML